MELNLLEFLQQHLIPLIASPFLLGLCGYFIWSFCRPSWLLQKELSIAISTIQDMKRDAQSNPVSPYSVAEKAMHTVTLKHLWQEFSETLHPQKTEIDGQLTVSQWRSTLPAETFFTTQTLVDTPLKTDYFRHSPGLMTGVGIIGTFSGLLLGLQNFKISKDNDVVQQSLAGLLQGVQEAFIISGIAIAAAMLTTFFEKKLTTSRYQQVEELCQLIDSLYNSGVGEEYLAELVSAAQTSATQATQLKDALITDFRSIMADLTQQHIAAINENTVKQQASTEHSNQQMTNAIVDALKPIAEAAKSTSETNGDIVTRALTEALTAFAAKMEDIFGGQLKGMNELLKDTMLAMQATVMRFDELAEKIGAAGTDGAKAMSDEMQKALDSLQVRQQTMNEQMGEFVQQIKSLVENSQSETANKLQETLELLGSNVNAMIGKLTLLIENAAEKDQQRAVKTNEIFGQATGDLSLQVQLLAEQSGKAVDAMKTTTSSMRDITSDSINRMNTGADTLHRAATNFADAGKAVTGVMQQTVTVSEKIQQSSTVLASSSKQLSEVMGGYEKARDGINHMVTELKVVVENARREATLTSELVKKLETAADLLGDAQTDAGEYLEQVSDVLAKAHQEFATNMESTLKKGNVTFNKELAVSVDYLRAIVQNIGDTLDSKMPPRR